MRSRRRSRAPLEEENLDRWLVSYADFITLLFAFFVVLYAVSSINEGKYRQVTESLTAAFDAAPRSLEPIQVGELNREVNDKVIETVSKTPTNTSVADTDSSIKNLRKMANAIEQEMLAALPPDDVTLRRSEQWLELEFDSRILFPSGTASLVPLSKGLLKKIAQILANHPNPINVEGFTDNQPVNTAKFPSNWELSASRAASVVQLFSENGVEPSRMAAIAYGQYRPIASNKTSEGRKMNRRVVVAILAGDLNVQQRQQKNAQNIFNLE